MHHPELIDRILYLGLEDLLDLGFGRLCTIAPNGPLKWTVGAPRSANDSDWVAASNVTSNDAVPSKSQLNCGFSVRAGPLNAIVDHADRHAEQRNREPPDQVALRLVSVIVHVIFNVNQLTSNTSKSL